MNRLHLEKKGLRALAIAESFKQGDKTSRLAGVIMRRDFIVDGFIFGNCAIEGDDATDSIIDMYERLDRDDINFIMISGLVIALYNIVDIKKINQVTKIPVIAVTYGESKGLESSIKHHFPFDYEKKIIQYNKLGARNPITLHTGYKLYLRTEGCHTTEAYRLLDEFTLQGSNPEPFRLAQLLARTNLTL